MFGGDPSQQEFHDSTERALQSNVSSLIQLEHVLDKVVHLCEHHKVNGQTGASVLGRRVARQPGEGVVLLQHISVGWKWNGMERIRKLSSNTITIKLIIFINSVTLLD